MVCTWSCSSINKKHIISEVVALEEEFHDHSGFVLYDPAESKTLISYQGDKYFTPASNTKILTLYLSLNVLGDSIPGLYYQEKGDSLIFWGAGDPSFLNKNLPGSEVYDFLANTEKELYFSGQNFYDYHFGPGWAWDDYFYSFSSEKAPFTIYGNNIEVTKDKNQPFLTVKQPFFKQYFWLGDSLYKEDELVRDYNSNNIIYFPSPVPKRINTELPFRYSEILFTKILADTLHKDVQLVNLKMPKDHQVIYGIAADSAYQEMMQESDNFIAEQLLLTCAGVLTDSLKAQASLDYGLRELLKDAPQEFVWMDGSGLSRYNLFTPNSLVWLWHKLYQQIPEERLFSLLPAGGQPGTLARYYKSEEPYLFAKTGTLSNNHNLSGFLRTKKGKLYIFAFMNNNYPDKSGPVKRKMEQILQDIYLNN